MNIFYHIIRKNSLYTLINAVSISTALFIYFSYNWIYYLEKHKTYIVAIACSISFQCFQTVLFFCENSCFHTAIAGAFVHNRNVFVSARKRPPASSIN